MEQKSERIANKFLYLRQAELHPAILIHMALMVGDWTEVVTTQADLLYMDKQRYIRWRNRMITSVLPIIGLDFDKLLPSEYPFLLRKLDLLDMASLLEASENVRDILFENPIGTLRRERWNYVQYNPEVIMEEERAWVRSKMQEILNIEDDELMFTDILMYVYWGKRLQVVR